MILAALASPIVTSCYDDSKLWKEVENVKNQVASLEARLNSELAALQYMLGADSAISAVKWDETNKMWKFTLANGSTLDFVPPTVENFQSLITTVEVDGAKYWATYAADGTATALTDADGNMYPVSVTPQVKTEDGVTYLSLDGNNWVPTCTNPSVFSNVEVVYTDNYTDEEEAEWAEETPMYAIFTLADGNTITLTLDGAGAIMLGGMRMPVYEYIPAGATMGQPVDFVNILEYQVELPMGWAYEEGEDSYGQTLLNITAPTADNIKSGLAKAEGKLKIFGVCEGGKVVSASSIVSTSAFKTMGANKGSMTLQMNQGVSAYYYGLVKASEFNADEIASAVASEKEMMGQWWAPWYTEEFNCGEYDIDQPLADMELTPGENYVVWAYPFLQDFVTYSWMLGNIEYKEFTYIDFQLEVQGSTHNSITIKASLVGTDMYIAGFGNKEYMYGTLEETIASELDEINYYFANGMVPALPYDGEYVGDPVEFADGYAQLSPAGEYYMWVIPYVPGMTKVSVADAYVYEMTTEPLQPGSTIDLTISDNLIPDDYKNVKLNVTSAEATLLYYSWVDPDILPTIVDKEAYLLASGTPQKITTGSAELQFYNMTPNQTKILVVMVVDAEGKYTAAQTKEATSASYQYNDINITLEVVGEPSLDNGVTFKVTPSAEVAGYIYYFELKDDVNIGDTQSQIEDYMALNPDMYYFQKPTLDDEGCFSVAVDGYGEYVIYVMAKNAAGVYSHAATAAVDLAFNLGNFVAAKDDNGNDNPAWLAIKEQISVTFRNEVIGDFTPCNYTITGIPEGFTAVASCFHPDYLTDYPSGADKARFIMTYPYINIFDVVNGEELSENYAAPGYNVYILVQDAEGNYYEPFVYDCGITQGSGFGQ